MQLQYHCRRDILAWENQRMAFSAADAAPLLIRLYSWSQIQAQYAVKGRLHDPHTIPFKLRGRSVESTKIEMEPVYHHFTEDKKIRHFNGQMKSLHTLLELRQKKEYLLHLKLSDDTLNQQCHDS